MNQTPIKTETKASKGSRGPFEKARNKEKEEVQEKSKRKGENHKTQARDLY